MPKGSLKTQFKSECSALRNATRRCHNSQCPQHDDYGQRGVFVCAEWRDPLTGFTSFLRYIGPKRDPNLTLERLDNDKAKNPATLPGSALRKIRKTSAAPSRAILDGARDITLSIPLAVRAASAAR